jgi:hypothetical protein
LISLSDLPGSLAAIWDQLQIMIITYISSQPKAGPGCYEMAMHKLRQGAAMAAAAVEQRSVLSTCFQVLCGEQ